jgi:divalent metal cation (Fe/Co/Zn/Cd) transporter
MTSAAALLWKVHPKASVTGIVLTAAALFIMPILSSAKRRNARITGDRALAADAVQSSTCAYLAAITLLGLAANAAFHLHWFDPVGALAAVPILCVEGRRALRDEHCGCC